MLLMRISLEVVPMRYASRVVAGILLLIVPLASQEVPFDRLDAHAEVRQRAAPQAFPVVKAVKIVDLEVKAIVVLGEHSNGVHPMTEALRIDLNFISPLTPGNGVPIGPLTLGPPILSRLGPRLPEFSPNGSGLCTLCPHEREKTATEWSCEALERLNEAEVLELFPFSAFPDLQLFPLEAELRTERLDDRTFRVILEAKIVTVLDFGGCPSEVTITAGDDKGTAILPDCELVVEGSCGTGGVGNGCLGH